MWTWLKTSSLLWTMRKEERSGFNKEQQAVRIADVPVCRLRGQPPPQLPNHPRSLPSSLKKKKFCSPKYSIPRATQEPWFLSIKIFPLSAGDCFKRATPDAPAVQISVSVRCCKLKAPQCGVVDLLFHWCTYNADKNYVIETKSS